MTNHFKVPEEGDYFIIKHEPIKNKLFEVLKKHNEDTDNLEDLYTKRKLKEDEYQSVKDTFEKLHRKELYILLNNLGDDSSSEASK